MVSQYLLVVACAVLVDAAAIVYDRCDAKGPDGWKLTDRQCGGLEQSPINLCNAAPFPRYSNRRDDDDEDDDKKMEDDDHHHEDDDDHKEGGKYTITLYGHSEKARLTIKNTGHTVEVSGVSPSLRVPSLHQLVGRMAADSVSNPDWQFAQMHLHWGRLGNANEGSEHVLAGRRFPAEAHFVHFNKARGSDPKTALATGKKDAVLVIGVFLELGPAEKETELIRVLSGYVPKLEDAANKTVVTAEKLALDDIIDLDSAYYTYGGSLTTPGCFEQVTWVVMQKPAVITSRSLDRLKTALEAEEPVPIAHFGNFRPLQPLGSRKVYVSKGSSLECPASTLADTCFNCIGSDAAREASTSATDNSETCSSTPFWVWIIIGVALPSAMVATMVATITFMSWRQRKGYATDEMVVFTPLHDARGCGGAPNSAIDEECISG